MRLFLTVTILFATTYVAGAPPRESIASDFVDPASKLPLSFEMVRASGKIFSGTVLRIEHHNSDSSSALATTRIVLRVDQAIRNVRRGQTVELNEWAGLWQAGERYRAGERVLIFLYPVSRLGLTSPVGAHAGRFAVDRAGRVILKSSPGTPRRSISIRLATNAIRQAEKERLR